ncbi:MAG: prepilin peptidase [Actinomycetota bacterium]
MGLLWGSFATVAAHRIPRRESFLAGRSKCPNCGKQINAIDNIPVISYVLLRGKCRNCGHPISIRYPLIEIGTAILFGLAAWKFDITIAAFAYAAFSWALVVLTVIDLEHQLLPNRVVGPTFVAGWALLIADALVEDRVDRLWDAALGAVIFGGFFFVVAYLVPKGMGMGDVKLAFVLGTFLGYVDAPGVVLAGMFLSFFVGGVTGIVWMLVVGGDRKMAIPFGPFLALGSILGIYLGRELVDAYLGLF